MSSRKRRSMDNGDEMNLGKSDSELPADLTPREDPRLRNATIVFKAIERLLVVGEARVYRIRMDATWFECFPNAEWDKQLLPTHRKPLDSRETRGWISHFGYLVTGSLFDQGMDAIISALRGRADCDWKLSDRRVSELLDDHPFLDLLVAFVEKEALSRTTKQPTDFLKELKDFATRSDWHHVRDKDYPRGPQALMRKLNAFDDAGLLHAVGLELTQEKLQRGKFITLRLLDDTREISSAVSTTVNLSADSTLRQREGFPRLECNPASSQNNEGGMQ